MQYITIWAILELYFYSRENWSLEVLCTYRITEFELVFLIPHLVSNFTSFCCETYTVFLGHTEFYVIYQSNVYIHNPWLGV